MIANCHGQRRNPDGTHRPCGAPTFREDEVLCGRCKLAVQHGELMIVDTRDLLIAVGLRGGNLTQSMAAIEAQLPKDLECTNCDGRRCMDCVCRSWHDECVDDCPECCGGTAS